MGILITHGSRSHSGVNSRIDLAKVVFQKMRNVLNKNMTVATRTGTLLCHAQHILMHKQKLSRYSRSPRDMVLKENTMDSKKDKHRSMEETEQVRLLVNRIRKQQTALICHIMRREAFENVITTGKMEGR